jgi:hypothetical protein
VVGARLSQLFDEDQETVDLCQPSETHGIPDDDNNYHNLSTKISIGINTIAHRDLHSNHVGDGDNAHCKHETEPMYVMGSSNTP